MYAQECQQPSLAVVIVNYNVQDLIVRCLDSLNALNRANVSYLVVDHSPEPDTKHIENAYPAVNVLRPDHNRGFAGGCNLGITWARERGVEYILLLNPDARADGDFISPMLAVMQSDARVGVCTPRIVDDNDASRVQFAGGKINWWLGGPSHVVKERSLPDAGWYSDEFLTGCAMLLRAKAIEDVGLMDEDYFLYFEDADYSQVFLAKGWLLAYVPGAQVLHKLSSSTGFQSKGYVYLFSRNRIWFLRKWSPRRQYWFFFLFNTFIKIPAALLMFSLVKGRPGLAKAYLMGYWDGLCSAKKVAHGDRK